MSTMDDAEAVETSGELGDLDIAHKGGLTYIVSNSDPTDHDRVTAYEVDVGDLECSCEYAQQGPEGPTICKHVEKAILVAPTQKSVEVETFDTVIRYLEEARAAIDDIKDVRDVAQTAQNANAAAAVQSDSEESSSGGQTPLEKVRAAAEEAGVPVGDGVEIYEHDDYDSIQIEKVENIDDDEFSALKSFTSHDLVKYDQNNGLNFLKEEDVNEVVG